MIGIIDYGMGNLRSVQKAIEKVGGCAIVAKTPDQLKNTEKVILPGVGAFADGMANLKQRRWDEYIKAHVNSGQLFLGICLGLQLLFEGSQEDAVDTNQPVEGLGILPGQVVRFDENLNSGDDSDRLKVPHMGWNSITWQRNDPLLVGLEQGSYLYFVHSYYAAPRQNGDSSVTSAVCNYGQKFTASLWKDNVWATQFHPEKSQKTGLVILKNFVDLS